MTPELTAIGEPPRSVVPMKYIFKQQNPDEININFIYETGEGELSKDMLYYREPILST